MENEIFLFCRGIAAGCVLAAVFDVGRAMRKEWKHRTVWVEVEDFVFWIFTGLVLFTLVERYNQGILRWYVFGGCIAGTVFYRIIFQKIVFDALCMVFHMFYRVHSCVFGKKKKKS